MASAIKRTLVYEDAQKERKVIGEDGIVAIAEPIVILGDPGMGKSILTQMLGEQLGMKYYRAGTFSRAGKPESLIAEGERIIIDGLDEIASSVLGDGVDAILKQLSRMGNPPFILSCREADWRGAADRIKIEDDYATAPVLLHLQPFDREDAQGFLAGEFPLINAGHVLDHLADRGLDDIYKNPLTLRLIGEVAQDAGTLPNSRAELLDKACRVMLKEDNLHHDVQHRDEDLLLAGGAICATQLLCDRIGVFVGGYAKTPEGYVHVADIAKLPAADIASDAIKTRLFRAEGESRFTHVHRVVAEYLGAKWLAHCFDSGLSERRIFSLFRQGEGVPTSLRGLHAWTGHFSNGLARRCIAADPYAVLRYGNADTLDLEHARALLSALAKLSEEDPYFRSEDWGRHPVSGLMRTELAGEILAVISTPQHHTQLTMLLVEAMVGTELAKKIAPALESMMFDQGRDYGERAGAAEAMLAAGTVNDWEAVIRRWLKLGDGNSARLAFHVLGHIGAHTVAIPTCAKTLLAGLGLTGDRDLAHSLLTYRREGLFSGFDIAQLTELLDNIVNHARPIIKGAKHSAKSQTVDLVRLLVAKVLEADPAIAPKRVWAWIGWLPTNRSHSNPTTQRLAEVFNRESALRTGLLEHVLLTPCETNAWMAGFRLADTGLGLYPTSEDLVTLLRLLRARAGDGPMKEDLWCDLLRLGRSREGLEDIVYDAAVETAQGDTGLLTKLSEINEVTVPQWEIEQAEQEAEEEAERQKAYQSHRDILAKRTAEIADGDFRVLHDAADAYFGRFSDFDSAAPPEMRVREFLGDALAEQTLVGFMEVLNRDDLPSAAEIAEAHSKDKYFFAEAPMICGIAEMLRRDRLINAVDKTTLAAVLMAWHRANAPDSEHLQSIPSAIEAVLFTSEAEIETHFRTSIEPDLACRRTHPSELYRLIHESQWSALAGRLTTEWLRTYPELPAYVLAELMIYALENAPREEVHALVVDSRARVHPDYETMLMWLSADYVVDFENSRAALEEAAADDPGFLWFVRNRVESERHGISSRFSVNQIGFIVQAFGEQWPQFGRPKGVTSGNTNPWDASDFIWRAIHAIASSPAPEATEVLKNLLDGHASTYDDTIRHAVAIQRKIRRDHEYVAPSVGQIQAVMADALPETIDDMRAYFADRIETVQARMHGSNTDMWEAYWEGTKPKGETYCRNRLVEHISGQLPASIRFEPEMHMPGQKRADIAAIRNSIGLPVEIKGQWHRAVWTAPMDQLDAKYTRDWHAEGCGAYIVIWFGLVPKKNLPEHPDGLARPKTPQELRQMLIDRIPETRRSQIDVFVVDVSRLEQVV